MLLVGRLWCYFWWGSTTNKGRLSFLIDMAIIYSNFRSGNTVSFWTF